MTTRKRWLTAGIVDGVNVTAATFDVQMTGFHSPGELALSASPSR